MQPPSSYRRLNFFGLLISAGAVSYAALQLDSVLGSQQCAFCTPIRALLLVMAVLFALAWIHNPQRLGQRVYAFFNTLLALVGIAATGQMVWLELRPNGGDCGLLSALPQATLSAPLDSEVSSASQCGGITWDLFGISLPQIGLTLFIILLIVLWKVIRQRPRERLFY